MPQRQTKLREAFQRQQVMTLSQIRDTLGGSRMTAIRRLRELGGLSSYSHAGRYYTLVELVAFDALGLWDYQDIRFSRWGTLKRTVAEWVKGSAAGYSHRELAVPLRVRCHNVLLELIREEQLSREKIREPGPSYYFSGEAEIRSRQAAERRRLLEVAPVAETLAGGLPPLPLEAATTIAVLVESVNDPKASPAVLAHRVQKRGLAVSPPEVRQVFEAYDLDKKRAL